MKKKIGILLLLSIIGISTYFVWSSIMLKEEGVVAVFPNFSLTEVNGAIFTDKQIDFQKPSIVIIITSDCGTCNALLENFSHKNLDSVNLIVMTFDKKTAVGIRNKMYYKNFKILISSRNYLEEKFGKSTISSVFIYNTKRELIKHYIGSISPLKYIY